MEKLSECAMIGRQVTRMHDTSPVSVMLNVKKQIDRAEI